MIMNRAAARYAPSRFGFPMSKLIALFLARRADHEADDGRVCSLAFHHEQGAFESTTLALFLWLLASAFWSAVMIHSGASYAPALRLIGSLVAGFVYFNILVPGFGLLLTPLRARVRRVTQTVTQLLLCTAMAVLAMLWGGIVEYLFGALWLLWLVMNALAIVVLAAFKRSIDAFEEKLMEPRS